MSAPRVILITGAASGIGRATALRFARMGEVVALADINGEGLEETRALLPEGAVASLHTVDISQPEACEALVAEVVAQHGHLDVLANIAGVIDWTVLGSFTPAQFNRLVSINMGSVFFMSQAAVPHLRKTKGNIVNLGSGAGLVSIAFLGLYSATKAAVIAMSKSMAMELAADGVRVNVVCPGAVDTPMNGTQRPEGVVPELVARCAPKLGRLIDPDEIAGSIAYLASHDARSITGAVLAVDCAQTAG